MLPERNPVVPKVAAFKAGINLKSALFLPLAGLVLVASTYMARGEGETTISHGISTFGDLKYPVDFAHLDYVNPDAPKGGEITTWAQGTFDSFNAYARKGVSASMATIAIERLMTGTADEIGSAYCFICETLEYPEGREWVIFTLRPGVTFSDGSPVTAADVAFSQNLLLEQALPSYREAVSKVITNIEVLSDLRVKFSFADDAPFLERIETAGGTPIFSEAWVTANSYRLDESHMEPIMGTGAYALESFEINERIVYRRNPDYWGNDLPMNIGRNNFDTIRIEYFADGVAAFEGFKGGAYTFRIENSSKQWARQYDFPAIEAGHVLKAELFDGSQSSGQAFIFNLRREKFQDIRVRDAISRMFNFEWSNETLFYNLYARITGYATNSYNAAEGVPEGKELEVLESIAHLLPEGVIGGEAYTPPVSSNRQLDRDQLRAASVLLDEAGWTVGDDGLRRNAAGELLEVEFLEYSPAFDRVVVPFVENLKRLGVSASHNRVDTAQFVERRRGFDYDIVTGHLSLGYEPGGSLVQYFGTSEGDNSVFNLMGLGDPAVDELIRIARAADTKEDMVATMRALDRVLRAQKLVTPQWFKDVHTVAYFDMYEYPDPLPPYDLGYLDFWWFNADKHAALKAAGAL